MKPLMPILMAPAIAAALTAVVLVSGCRSGAVLPASMDAQMGEAQLGFSAGMSASRQTDSSSRSFAASGSGTRDLGEAVVGSSIDATINVTVSGGIATQVTGLVTGAGFSFKGGSYPGAGGTCASTISSACTLTLTFAPASAGSFSGNLRLTYFSGLSQQSAGLALSGTAGDAAVLSAARARSIGLGSVLVGGRATAEVTFSNGGGVSARSMSASVAAPFSIEGGTCGATLAAGASCTYLVALAPSESGSQGASLAVDYDNGAAAAQARISLNGTGVKVASAAVGGNFSCVVYDSGEVRCWGTDASGQLGDGDDVRALQSSPAPVSDLDYAASVSAGSAHACAASTDGGVFCWGDNADGQIGQGQGTEGGAFTSPTYVPGVLDTVAVASGDSFSCALDSQGAVMCWGAGFGGQAVAVAGLPAAKALSAGASQACVAADENGESGQVWCWTASAAPAPVAGLSGAPTVGRDGACALGADGSVACAAASGAVSTVAGFGPAHSVAAGNGFFCANLQDGQVFCWATSGAVRVSELSEIEVLAAGASGMSALAAGSFGSVLGFSIASAPVAVSGL